MPISVIKSGEFKLRPTRAKKAAASAPVFITEYGRPAYVMLNIEEYKQLIGAIGLPAIIKRIDTEFSNLFAKPLVSSELNSLNTDEDDG
ncbi:MAG: type II toxin-antitoxin system Phd/YefM family antitoxin [Pseudomonadota bacterium]